MPFALVKSTASYARKDFETESAIKVSEKGLLFLTLYSEKRGKLNVVTHCLSIRKDTACLVANRQ